MTNASKRACGVGFAALAAILLATSPTLAGPVRSSFVAACDDGHYYLVRARAVSDAGDLVTGELLIGRRAAPHPLDACRLRLSLRCTRTLA
jgi:hypothetical protein